AERERRVLAKIVIAACMAHLDRAVLHRVKHLQAGYDLACGEHLELKLVLAEFSDPLGHVFGRSIERVERLRPARPHPPPQRRHPPPQLRHGLSNGRSGDRGPPHPDTRRLEKFPSLHGECSSLSVSEFFRRRTPAQECNIYRWAKTKRIAPSNGTIATDAEG